MSSPASDELDVVLHQPLRTRVVAYLAARGEATFTELKTLLEVTDGNLEAHIKKLRSVDYISVHKESGNGRPQTFYRLTRNGKAAFKQYISQLQDLLNI